jgi:zinc protease
MNKKIILKKLKSLMKKNGMRSVTAVFSSLLLLVLCVADISIWASSACALESSPAEISEKSEDEIKSHAFWPHEQSELKPDPNLVFGRLENGFRYVLMENNRPKNRVSLHLYVNAGSLNETDEQQGIAHYLEHMLFNGSIHFPPGELVRYFQNIGMQFGNDANAHTGFNETVYDVILPSGDKASIQKGLLVVKDYANGALLLEEEVNRERGVILAEKRSRDSAGYRTFKATLNFELPDFLASRRMPIGKSEVIQKTDRALLKDYYDAWYRPDNTVLVMVGDFSVHGTEGLVRKAFEDFKPRAKAPVPQELGTIDHEGVKAFYHHEPEDGGTTVSIEVLRSHIPVSDSLQLRKSRLVEGISNQIFQNRLDSNLKKANVPYISAIIGSGVYLNHIRYAEVSADCSAGEWEATLTVLERELRRAEKYGFTGLELSRVKKDILNQLDNAVREAPTRDSTRLARRIIRDLSRNEVTLSPEQKKTMVAPMIEAVSLQDAHKAFRDAWATNHRLILVTGNTQIVTRASQSPEESIEMVYRSSMDSKVKRPEENVSIVFPYLEKPKDIGTIVSKEISEDLGIHQIQLDNGIGVNLKPTDFKSNEVLATLTFGLGKASEPKKFPGISMLAEGTLEESGLGRMDSEELARAMAGTSTYVDFRISEDHFQFFGETVTDELDLLFQLLHAHIIDPAFRDDALSLAKERLRQGYESLSKSIDGAMRIEGLNILAGGDSRFGMPAFEKIEAIETEDIRQWIGPLLAHAPLELSIVGDFERDRAIALAKRYLGSMQNRSGFSGNARTDLPDLPTGTVNRINVNTQIPKAMVVAAWKTDDFWNIHRTRRLSVLADVFSERLRLRIREKLGASYSPFAFNRASRAYPGYGVFQANINVAPDQTETVLSEVKAIATDLAQQGVSEDELKRAIEPILNSIKTLRQTNGYWLNSVMKNAKAHPQQLDWARHFVKDYAAITAKELNELSAFYLTEERAAAVIVAPQK